MVQAEEDTDVRPLLRPLRTPDEHAAALSVLEEALRHTENPLRQARLHQIAADLCASFRETYQSTRPPKPWAGRTDYAQRQATHEAQAFAAVRQAIAASIVAPRPSGHPVTRPPGHPITLRLPVRVDLAGGWTDTPPYSLEKGGAVLNAAVLLKGRYPIEVTARWLDEPVIRLKALDQNQEAEIRDPAELQDYACLNDPLALHRAVLVASDLPDEAPSHFQFPISNSQFPFPGLELTTGCHVPLGSGLGTSSILAAGLVMAVWRLKGIEWTEEQLFNQVLLVEQMLTAGGGWQDQVGGVVPGFKLTTTQPGLPQRFQVDRLELAPETLQTLSERLLLAYTGQQRVAKNILQLIVADWLSRRQDLVTTLTQLREDAYTMREALVAGDIDTFGRLLTRYWEGKKVLNAHTTNPTIEALLERVTDCCAGYGIAGAGGGGFLVLLAKDAARRAAIEQRLAAARAVVYPWEIVP